jgi:DNA-binding NarL/FixJ family response regulator
MRVAVIAQSPAVRAGLRVLLGSDPSLTVVGDGTSLADLDHAPLQTAQIAVVQGQPGAPPSLPPSLRGLVFVVDAWQSDAAPQIEAVAWAALPADAGADELIAAVRGVFHGLLVVHPDFAAQLFTQKTRSGADSEPLIEPLTARETEVLQLIGQGLANKMIADRLHISEHTVKFHVSAIYAKLSVASRTEAVRAGARRGLIVL